MTLQYVRDYYGVPAIRGRRVTYNGRPGQITSADHRIRVRFDGDNFSSIIHPTEDGLIYLGAFGKPLWPTSESTEPHSDAHCAEHVKWRGFCGDIECYCSCHEPREPRPIGEVSMSAETFDYRTQPTVQDHTDGSGA